MKASFWRWAGRNEPALRLIERWCVYGLWLCALVAVACAGWKWAWS